MKYRELFQFEPIEAGVQLRDADTKDGAARLVSSYVISEAMASSLTDLIFPHLQTDQLAGGKAVLVVGNHGMGKSHLLSVISSLAEYADLADAIKNPAALKVDEAARTKRCVGVDAIAGRFKVIRTEIAGTTRQLRDVLLSRIEKYLTSQGVAFTFPAAGPEHGDEPAFDQMMAAFHEKFPEHGLLLVVDELLDYLRTRTDKELVPDLNFLGEIGAVCQRSKFRFVAGLQEPIFDNPRVGLTADYLRRLKGSFEQVRLGPAELRFVVSERLVRKTAAQRNLVMEYLAEFAKYYGTMSERMEEFAALFPIHPDYLDVCDKITFTEQRELLLALSDAAKKLLNDTIPQDHLRLIAYDSYWDKVCRTPAFREVHDVEAVMESTLVLEDKIEKSAVDPEHKALAVRLLHALAVHRLTTGDINSKLGSTPTELRDMLCLYHPGAEDMGLDPADDLLLFVHAILDLVKKLTRGKLVAFDPSNDQYYFRFTRFRRFVKPELLLHWVNAIPFVALMITGGIMLASRFWHIDHQVFAQVVLVHKFFATFWLVGMPLVLCLRPRVHWMHIRLMLSWGADDLLWLVQSVRSSFDKTAIVPPAGRFNTGQKINACLVMLYFFGFVTTGISMHFKGTMLFPWYVHTALFCASINTVGGHLFLALVNPSTRISLLGIFHGWSPMEYIEHHHPLSLPRSRQSHVQPVDARKAMGDIIGTKVHVILFAASLLMATAGTLAFHQGMIASARLHFEKKFSALISPSQLSTKHRMGASSERCTKCHSYTGSIPNDNCEQCHQVVKEHRAKGIGYHGTLKGDCFQCHKEHPTGTNSLIPLVRESFKHALTGFELEGKHGRLACDECHKKKRTPDAPGYYYIGLKRDSCTDCHKEPHGSQFTVSCEKCHSAKGWTGKDLKFSHAVDSTFKLAGKHSTLDCAKCHKPKIPQSSLGTAAFKGLSQDCKGCHEDPHRQQFAVACTSCHSPAGWNKDKLSFDHNKDAKFSLVEKHADVACEKCHLPGAPGAHLASAQFHNLKSECADCHKDPHRGQFERACTKCHSTPVEWKVARLQFQHNKDTKYPLSGKHASVDCIKCHKPKTEAGSLGSATFKGLATGCEACHKVSHPSEYGPSCTACHTFASFPKKNPGFEHIFKIKIAGENLIGKHLSVKCSACHDGVKVGSLELPHESEYVCLTCHQRDDPHKNVLGNNCSKCHGSEGWKGENLRFNHDTMANFSLDQDHRKLACTKCHENGHWKPLDSKCESCHSKRFLEKTK